MASKQPYLPDHIVGQIGENVKVDAFDCIIPIHVYPTDWEGGKIFSSKQRFGMVEM
jgi:hypothetical protein